MAADLVEKTDRYERLLANALDAFEITVSPETPLRDIATEFETMARSYHADGRHFLDEDDPVNALSAFAYGHAWLDAGARLGVFAVPESELFAA